MYVVNSEALPRHPPPRINLGSAFHEENVRFTVPVTGVLPDSGNWTDRAARTTRRHGSNWGDRRYRLHWLYLCNREYWSCRFNRRNWIHRRDMFHRFFMYRSTHMLTHNSKDRKSTPQSTTANDGDYKQEPCESEACVRPSYSARPCTTVVTMTQAYIGVSRKMGCQALQTE